MRDARIALGGVATIAVARLRGRSRSRAAKALDDAALQTAARRRVRQAQPREHNAFKIELGKRTLVRALRQAAALEIPT